MLVLLAMCCLLAADEPRFDPPPRLAISGAELAGLRNSADFASQRDAAVRSAESLLEQPPVVPTGAGDWTFYYACPDDASTLTPLTLDEHRCPKCGKVFSDERTVAAYRTRLHDRANDAALRAAWAFAYSDDGRFAAEARRILLRCADDYASYPKRRDRWGRTGIFAPLGGRRYAQSLDEAVGIIRLAKAYDLTRGAGCWTDADRQHVEHDLFQATADTLLWWNQDINNHQTWYNAGLMAIASVLGDAALVRKVLDMRGGFHDQLRRSVGDDGLWYEGALAYHNYALQAMIEIVDAGRRMGLPLHEEPRFRSMLVGPLDYAYPNGQFPAINDSDHAHLGSFDAHFVWAWKTYRDPRFVAAYARGDEKRSRQLLGDAAADTPLPVSEPTSRNLASSGLAVLRRGRGPDAVCAMLDYGPHGGHHGHDDKLNLMLFANGREWLLDPGRLTYSHNEYKTWVKETAAHNTVTIGGRSQGHTEGTLLWFVDRPDYAACAATSDRAYADAKLTRFLLLADRFLVDRFDVAAAEPTQIDWFAHAMCPQVQPVEDRGPGRETTLGDHSGYQHLTGGRAWDVRGPSRWEFRESADTRLGMWLLGEPGGPRDERIFTSNGIGYWIGRPAPCLTRRVTSRTARFQVIYDLSPKGDYVRGVTADRAAIVVHTRDGERRVTFGDADVGWAAK